MNRVFSIEGLPVRADNPLLIFIVKILMLHTRVFEIH